MIEEPADRTPVKNTEKYLGGVRGTQTESDEK
jgi:hypothetical protein